MNPSVSRLDPLLWLVLLGAVGLLVPHLPVPVLGMTAAALAWRGLHERSGWPLPHRLALAPLAFVGGAFVLWHFHALWGRDAGVSLLVIAAGLKLLETREARDHFAVLLLSFFLLVSTLLFDQSIGIFLLVAALFWLLVAAWIGVSQPLAPPIAARLRDGGRLLAAGLPFALILFMLFPRPPGGLWGAQQPGGSAQTGLSERLRPGDFDSLGRDPSPAFRVRFEDRVLPPERRYWRVYVMSRLDPDAPEGWIADPRSGRPRLDRDDDSIIGYEVTLEPSGMQVLPSVPAPVETPGRSRVDSRLILGRPVPVDHRLRYRVASALEYRLDADGLSPAERERNLRTAGLNPLIADLAADWRELPPAERVERALRYFRDHDFRYTLDPGRREGADRADRFVFDTRRGYCSDYADAFARMMRAAGVPARLVSGYQGGEINDEFLVVRQSDAHAWTEVWLEGEGWRRVDPTTTVAPERIETGVAAAMANDPTLPGVIRRDDDDWGAVSRRLLERFDNRWNQYVLGYDSRIQLDLIDRLGLAGLSTIALALLAPLVAVLVWLAVLWWLGRRADRRAAGSTTDYLWQRLASRLARLGIARMPRESERAYLERAARGLPGEAEDLLRVATLLQARRYGRHPTARQEALLHDRIRALRRRLWLRRRRPDRSGSGDG